MQASPSSLELGVELGGAYLESKQDAKALGTADRLIASKDFGQNPDDQRTGIVLVPLPVTFSVPWLVTLLPALVMLWVKSRPGEALSGLRWPLIGAYGLLAGTVFVSHSMTLGRFGGLSNFVVSHWLFGTLVLIGLLAILRSQRGSEAKT